MKIHFKDVGRDKNNWTSECDNLTESWIAKEAKRNGGLLSSGVEAIINDSGLAGDIIVGGWRSVGKFTIER